MNPALLALILTQAQANWLSISYNIGSEQNEGYTLSAIVWQESSFCQRKINLWSRGCGGLKRSTARLFDPGVTRKQLTDDNERNLHDSLLYLLECKRRTDTWRRMVFAYHWGIPASLSATERDVDGDKYVLAISAKVRALEGVNIDEN